MIQGLEACLNCGQLSVGFCLDILLKYITGPWFLRLNRVKIAVRPFEFLFQSEILKLVPQ